MSSQVGDPGAIYRMQIGAFVRTRLLRTPMAFKIPAQGLDIFVVREFLTPKECQDVITLIDQDRVPSGLLAPSADPDFRTSESCNLRPSDPTNQHVERKINALTGIEPRHGETIQGQRYSVGQQFKPHHDFFYKSEAYWEEMQRTGGQRTWTSMVFLNEPAGGGQTHFPKANVRVTPRTGNILIWNNLDEFGEPNPYSLHTGLPVERGVKYVITKWYRERPWGWYGATGTTPNAPYY
jgi:prolyl 4-hydroxylase